MSKQNINILNKNSDTDNNTNNDNNKDNNNNNIHRPIRIFFVAYWTFVIINIVNAIHFLIKSNLVNGSNINIDGGI